MLFFHNLFERRVPQILGSYFLASIAVIQFVGWLVDRYLFSPYLVNFCIVLLVSFIPSAMLIAYYHGKPGRNQWVSSEKIGIPLNILLSAMLLFVLFSETELGVSAEKIVIKDELGQSVERVIAKKAFRKDILIFPFENETQDSTHSWLSYAIPLNIHIDLMQDFYVRAQNILFSSTMPDQLKKMGFPAGIGAPFTLKQKIAVDLNTDYFLDGKIHRDDNTLKLSVYLYQTKNSKRIAEHTFTNSDILNTVDELSVQVRTDLNISKRHIEDNRDLPIAELTTKNNDAAKHMALGFVSFRLFHDLEKATKHLEIAVKQDDNNTFGHAYLAMLYAQANRIEDASLHMEKMMHHIYKIPEHLQFELKDLYYSLKGYGEKRFKLIEMRAELYPDEIDAHVSLAQAHLSSGRWDEGLQTYENVLNLAEEPELYFHDIGNIYINKGEYKKALSYFQDYAETFPGKAESSAKLGQVYSLMGNFEQAEIQYEKALLIDPGNISNKLSIAHLYRNTGKFDKALANYENALASSKTSNDKRVSLWSLRNYYEMRGQMSKSLEILERVLDLQEKTYGPLSNLLTKIFYFDRYARAGKGEQALKELLSLEQELQPPMNKITVFGFLKLHIEMGELEKAKAVLPVAEHVAKEFGIQFRGAEQLVPYSKARIFELDQNFDEAILLFRQFKAQFPSETTVNIDIGRCYRKSGQLDEAEEYVLKSLATAPFGPKTNQELAFIYADKGMPEKALAHLKVALKVWENADEGFKPAKEAREKLAELNANL
ncbi:MAG: tetratricopeptide repeat protein [Calditrichaeota bacterium]|nr:MAG: tetratricopeptide repeat protein [Calditrichota bacterium]